MFQISCWVGIAGFKTGWTEWGGICRSGCGMWVCTRIFLPPGNRIGVLQAPSSPLSLSGWLSLFLWSGHRHPLRRDCPASPCWCFGELTPCPGELGIHLVNNTRCTLVHHLPLSLPFLQLPWKPFGQGMAGLRRGWSIFQSCSNLCL